MKKVLIAIIILLTVSCSKITVLEVSIDKGIEQNRYKVIYHIEAYLEYPRVYTKYFNTTLGVHNFLTQTADIDLSGWEVK